jgi:uncharacterized Zn finger protein (UPF0148 family)
MYCSNCKITIVESQGEVFIPCTCEATIVAEIEATVIQHSSLE